MFDHNKTIVTIHVEGLAEKRKLEILREINKFLFERFNATIYPIENGSVMAITTVLEPTNANPQG